MSSRLAGALLIAASAALACGGDEGPAAPGGRGGITLTYVTPRLQVVPSGAPAAVELALEVRRAVPAESSEPWAGARLRVRRTRGLGALSSTLITADERGIARVEVALPAAGDKTTVVVSLERDSDSYLPFDVVSAPVVPVDLAPGQVLDLDPPRDGAILRFAAPADAAARWVLMPYQTDVERGGTPYRFFHQPVGAGAGAAAFGAEAIAEPYRAPLPGTAPQSDVRVGDVDPGPLRPASSVANEIPIKSCSVDSDRKAPLRYLGRSVAIYVDDDPSRYQARIDSLGREFDDRTLPTNTSLFGPTTDLDGNGVVLIVLTPALSGGAYCDSVRRLRVEALYATWSPSVRIEALMALIAHEHQHLIHSGLRRRGADDALWINEGMSLAAEALNGYWNSALPRVWHFLNGQNGGLTMLPIDYTRAFDDAYMMFFLYLGDRFGPDVYQRLGSSGRFGIVNVEFVTGQPFATTLHDWFVASGASERGAVHDPRFAYESVRLQGMGEEIARCECVPVQRLSGMRLELLILGEGFDAFRTLDRADADYYELVAPPALPAALRNVYYDAYGRQAVKLTIVRTQ